LQISVLFTDSYLENTNSTWLCNCFSRSYQTSCKATWTDIVSGVVILNLFRVAAAMSLFDFFEVPLNFWILDELPKCYARGSVSRAYASCRRGTRIRKIFFNIAKTQYKALIVKERKTSRRAHHQIYRVRLKPDQSRSSLFGKHDPRNSIQCGQEWFDAGIILDTTYDTSFNKGKRR